MTHVSLFSGIGGLDLAAEWAGFETVLFCEKDPYCQKVLARHWPGVPIIDDIRSVKRESISGPIDVVSGGFPCQPFSHAGERGGTGDDRYLWPEMLRVIRELKPRWVVAENVPGLLSIDAGLVFETVLSDLEREGYETLPLVYPAASVGAPHKRDRVFFVAHRIEQGLEGHARNGGGRDEPGRDSAETGRSACPGGICADVADCNRERELQPERLKQEQRRRISDGRQDVADAEELGRGEGNTDAGVCVAGTGETEERIRPALRSWWETEPDVGRVAHEFPRGMDGGINDEICNQKEKSEDLRSLHEAMREVWKRRESTTTPSELSIGRLYDSLPNMPRETTRRAWYLGAWVSKNKKLYHLWKRVCTSSFEEAQYLLERLLKRDWTQERSETLASEPGIPRVSTGDKNRVNRLRALGNAVVPQQAYPIFAAIAATEQRGREL